MSRILKALSDPTRREVLALLRRGPRTAGYLSSHFAVSRPTMSAHFSVLREAGLIASEREGKNIIYHLQMSVLEETLMALAGSFGLSVITSPDNPVSKGNDQ